MNGVTLDDEVREYIDAVPSDHRPLFDRIHSLILEVHPEVNLVISYKMPTYKLGKKRLHVANWKHGVSIYGWKKGGEPDFIARHPELKTSTGTIQVRPRDANGITDDEFRDLVRSSLDT